MRPHQGQNGPGDATADEASVGLRLHMFFEGHTKILQDIHMYKIYIYIYTI